MRISNEYKVGIFTVIILIVLYISIAFLKGSNVFSLKHNHYFVIYDKGGSKPGDYILINGIKVGSVTKTEFLKKELKIKVDFEIESGIILYDKTIAVLNGSGIFPGRSTISLLNIEKDGIPVKRGSEINGAINQSFTEELMTNSAPIMDDIKSASALISDLAGILAKNQLRINSAIANLELLTSNIKDYILKNKDFFDDITKNTSKIIASFADEQIGIGSVIASLNESLKKVNTIDIKEINLSIKEFRKLISKVQQRGTSIGEFLHNADIYYNLNNTITNLNDLLINIKTQPGRYLHFSVFGKKPVIKKEK